MIAHVLRTLVVASLAAGTLQAQAPRASRPAPPPATTVLAGAWLIDGTGAPAVDNAWVRIEGGTIAAVGQGTPPNAAGAQVIDVKGKTLMPGLADMHVHLRDLAQARWMLKLLLAHGVTNVRSSGDSLGDLQAIRKWMASEETVPHLYIAGATINGSATGLTLLKPGRELRGRLADNLAFGVDFIKVHNWVSSQALRQIAEFCKANDLWLFGHVPLGMTSVEGIDIGMKTLEHVRLRPSEVLDDPELIADYPLDLGVNHRDLFWAYLDPQGASLNRTLDAWAKRKDMFYIDPTLTVREAKARLNDESFTAGADMRLVSPAMAKGWRDNPEEAEDAFKEEEFTLARKAMAGQITFVGLAHARGVRVLSGTDSPVPYVIPGVSLLRELELLVEGGLTPIEAVRSSTGRAAEALRRKDRGIIAAGQAADLVIVSGNVGVDISAVKSIERVVLAGRLYDRARLMDDAAKLAAEHQPALRTH